MTRNVPRTHVEAVAGPEDQGSTRTRWEEFQLCRWDWEIVLK